MTSIRVARQSLLAVLTLCVLSLFFLYQTTPSQVSQGPSVQPLLNICSPQNNCTVLPRYRENPSFRPSRTPARTPSSSPEPYKRTVTTNLYGTRTPPQKLNHTIDTTVNAPVEIALEDLFGSWINTVQNIHTVDREECTFKIRNGTLTMKYVPLKWFIGVDNITLEATRIEEDGSERRWTGEIHIRVKTPVTQNQASLIPPKWYKFSENDNLKVTNVLVRYVNKPIIPDKDNWLNRRYNTCAIVGNGGSLRGSKRGQEIDSHDVVVRLNLSPFLEFSQDVGSKLTIAFANGLSSDSCWKRNKTLLPLKAKYEIIAQATSEEHWKRVGNCSARSSLNNQFFPMSYYFVDLVDNILNEYHRTLFNGTTKKYRSTGMMAVTAMAMICDHVSVYGFERGPNMENKYYDSALDREWHGHSFPAEKAYFRDLANGTGLFEPFLELYDLYKTFSYIVD